MSHVGNIILHDEGHTHRSRRMGIQVVDPLGEGVPNLLRDL